MSIRALLMDIESRYADALGELGPRPIQDFEHMIDCVDAFLDLLADPRTDFRVKLMCYGKLGEGAQADEVPEMRAGGG